MVIYDRQVKNIQIWTSYWKTIQETLPTCSHFAARQKTCVSAYAKKIPFVMFSFESVTVLKCWSFCVLRFWPKNTLPASEESVVWFRICSQIMKTPFRCDKTLECFYIINMKFLCEFLPKIASVSTCQCQKTILEARDNSTFDWLLHWHLSIKISQSPSGC